jgi:hypothetical protein
MYSSGSIAFSTTDDHSPSSPLYDFDAIPVEGSDQNQRRASFLNGWSAKMDCLMIATAKTGDGNTLVITDTPPKTTCGRCYYIPFCLGPNCKVRAPGGEWKQVAGGAFTTDFDLWVQMGADPTYHEYNEYSHAECGEDCDKVYVCTVCKNPLTVEEDALPIDALSKAGIDICEPIPRGARYTMPVTHTTRKCACEGGCGELFSQRHFVKLKLPTNTSLPIEIDSEYECGQERARKRKAQKEVLDAELAAMAAVERRLRDDTMPIPQGFERLAKKMANRIATLADESIKRRRLLPGPSE